jgi:RHS repeat-associated protein
MRSQEPHQQASYGNSNEGKHYVSRRSAFSLVACCVFAVVTLQHVAWSQDYLAQTGHPTFATTEPVELGYINSANGNLHLEIPLGSFPQRGNKSLSFKLVYDSRIWAPNNPAWTPTNVSGPWSGWRLASSADAGSLGWSDFSVGCGLINYNYIYTAPDGTQHLFPVEVPQSSACGSQNASGSASDASGYVLTITNGVPQITAPDGTVPGLRDTNGNLYSVSGGNVVDNLGRTPVTTTTNCGGLSNKICYNILNSQGGTMTVTVTTESIAVHTAFNQQYSTEYNGNITVIQSIALPDGTTYQFGYDSGTTSGHYGEITSIALPTLGTINYSYSVFLDALSKKNRWVTQRTSGGGTWSYTPGNANTSAKTQQVTVTKPSGDYKTYTFSLNNGAWKNSVAYSSGTTVTDNWDTSIPCTTPPNAPPCTGSASIRKLNETTSLPGPNGTINQTKQFTYSGTVSSLPVTIKEWNYYSGSLPTNPSRITNITYTYFSRPTSVILTDGTGATKLKETDYGYDEAGGLVAGPSPVSQHDPTFDTSKTTRGNRTSIKQWTSGSSFITTATLTYDTTGQMVQAKDANNNPTTFSYTDCFYNDGNPVTSYTAPTPTNAYLTTTTLANSKTMQACYYFGTGKTALTKDQNTATTSYHFLDSDDRPTTTYLPIGWVMNSYTSATVLDTYLGIQATTPTTVCASASSCRHGESVKDTLGRPIDQILVNDPDGQTTVQTDYDTNGRVLDTSHPYRSTSDPTYGLETVYYDNQDRPVAVKHPDGNVSSTVYGSAVPGAGGKTTQLCGSNCNLGYPVLTTDEAGKVRQVWTDAFGKTVEVDEPAAGSHPGTSTGTITFTGSEQLGNACPNSPPYNCPVYDGGYFTATIAGNTYQAGYGQGSTTSSLATALASAIGSNPNAIATATSSGGVVTITAKYNYPLSVVLSSWSSAYFSSPSYSASASGFTGNPLPLSTPTTTYYQYDLLGNLTLVSVISATECNRNYTYDTLSRMLTATEPEPGNGSGTCPLNSTHTTTYSYLTSGSLACSGDPSKVCLRTDGRPTTTTYTYDTLNRPTGMTYSDSTPSVTYYYDQATYNSLTITNGAGRRTGMSDGSGTTAWSYDPNGNVLIEKRTVTAVSPSVTKTTTYAYNGDNSLKQLTYPTGRVVNFTVSNAERTTAAVDNNGTQYAIAPSSGAMYAPPGGLASAVYGKGGSFNGITETRSYNNRLQLTGVSASSSAGTAINLAPSYTATGHNNNGEIMSITNSVDTGRTENLAYDALSRISSAVSQATSGGDCWGQSFTIDAVGNLTNINGAQCGSTILNTAVNGNNQLSSGYTYDAAGNLTNDGLYSYTYNAENEITTANGVTYTYDGNRMRVKKSSGTLYWRTTDGTVIAETNLSGTTTNEYIFFGHRRIVRRDAGGNTYYYQADQVGSARVITNSSGAVCFDDDYTPYGQELSHTNSCPQNYKFTGYERDSETGLDYAYNRYYNSRIGRFMSADPSGLASANFNSPQSLNRYAYVQNNPISAIDPSGLNCYWDDGTYDSSDDPDTGSKSSCQEAGGTWNDNWEDSWDAPLSPEQQFFVMNSLFLAEVDVANKPGCASNVNSILTGVDSRSSTLMSMGGVDDFNDSGPNFMDNVESATYVYSSDNPTKSYASTLANSETVVLHDSFFNLVPDQGALILIDEGFHLMSNAPAGWSTSLTDQQGAEITGQSWFGNDGRPTPDRSNVNWSFSFHASTINACGGQ